MFVSGLGFTGSQALTNAFIVTSYPGQLRGPAIGWALAVGRPGAITGPLAGAVVLSSLDVRWNFYLFAIPGLVGAVLAALVPVVRGASPARTDGATVDLTDDARQHAPSASRRT